jgi:hypothetical protein
MHSGRANFDYIHTEHESDDDIDSQRFNAMSPLGTRVTPQNLPQAVRRLRGLKSDNLHQPSPSNASATIPLNTLTSFHRGIRRQQLRFPSILAYVALTITVIVVVLNIRSLNSTHSSTSAVSYAFT